MALALLPTTAFERDLRRALKQGRDPDKMEEVVGDCHVQPDWLLLYRVTETELILV